MLRTILSMGLFVAALLVTITLDQPTMVVQAQPKAPPPFLTPPPQAPTLAIPIPLGVQRGTTFELNLTGTNLADPVSVWTSFPAKATFPTDMNNGKEPTKLRVKLEVPADAPIGYHSIRVATKYGISNARLFCVDDLPQVVEVETNRTKATAQSIPVPSVVYGRTDAEASDYFKINVVANQRLTFEVLGRRLGSALDPIILIHDAKTGREMPGLYSDDAPGLQTDARLTHTFKQAGEYVVEIRDTTHRGGPDFHYRIRIGDFPAAITAFPLGIKKGSKSAVNFAGPSIDGCAPVEIVAPTDKGKTFFAAAPKGSGAHGWPVQVTTFDFDAVAEKEPNNDIASAQKIPVPCSVTGRFLEKSDVDVYSFPAKKGVKYTITAETIEINSPAEVYLIVKDAKNADLAKSVPANPSARIEYTAVADGDLFVQVEHLNFIHGPNEIYHLLITTPEPDFDIAVGLDRFEVTPGGSTLIPITTINRRDCAVPIELTVLGHPGLTGSVTIPANVVSGPPPKAPAPPPTHLALLPLQAKADVAIGGHQIQIQAKAVVNGKEVIRLVNVTELVKASLGGLTTLPGGMLYSIGVGVVDKPLFAIAPQPNPIEAVRGVPVTVTINAKREMGFAEDIAISALGLPANVTAAVKPVGKGTDKVEIQITAAAAAVPGTYSVVFRGTAKFQNKDFAFQSPIVSLTVGSPFELKLEPAQIILKPGEKAKVKVTVVRKGGFMAAIDVELKNLPANVTAAKAQIAMGKNDIELEITAAPAAVAGDKPDVNATGIAAGTTITTPNVTVRVVKEEKKDPKKEEKKDPKKDEKKDPKKDEKK